MFHRTLNINIRIAAVCGLMSACAILAHAADERPGEGASGSKPKQWIATPPWRRKEPIKSTKGQAQPVSSRLPDAQPQLADEELEPISTADESASVNSNSPKTVIEGPNSRKPPTAPVKIVNASTVEGDFWIVSSRGCDASAAPSDACRCLNFFHRQVDKKFNREPGEAFLASLQPDVPVCFVVHGSYNRWGDIVTESGKIDHWLKAANPGVPLQVVFFTWPADGNLPIVLPVDLAVLGRRSSAHSIYLAKLITQLNPNQPVCLLGHSHGARACLATLHLLGGGRLEEGQTLPAGCAPPARIRAVLVAAAVDHNWMNPGQRYDKALCTPEKVLLLRNSRDGWLSVYQARKIAGERALGKDGLGTSDRAALGELSNKVVDLNATQFTSNSHAFASFHERPELGAAVLPFVYFQDEPGATAPPAKTSMAVDSESELPPLIPAK